MLKDWTTFQKTWLGVFTLINIYLFFAWGDSLLGLISSISGMLCVVLVAKGKISNYYFGIVQAGTYAYMAYSYGLYGEAMLNGLFYFPLQFVGIYMWNRNKTNNDVAGEDIVVKKLKKSTYLPLIFICGVITVAYTYVLNLLGGSATGLDSITNVLSITAFILMLKRYTEQWVAWIIVNVLTIAMWVIVLIQTGGNDFSMLVMWTAFLFNSIYAWFNWSKMHKAQKEVLV